MVYMTGYNVAITMFTGLGAVSYGYAFSAFATSIGQPGFYLDMHLDPTSSYASNIIGAVSSLFCLGCAIGAIAQGWISDWLGRRGAIALAASLTLVGGALVSGSVNVPMLVVMRLIQGLGVGQLISLVPLYITEVAPPHRRGVLSGLTACGLTLGYITASWAGFGAFFSSNTTLQWRLPLALSCLFPLLLLSGIFWLPESPRYLSWIGKSEESWQIIRRIHHDPNDPSESAARAEFVQITKQIEFDREMKAGYWQILMKPSWRKRALLAMFITFAAQSTGTLGITNFAVIIYEDLGMTGYMPLLMYCIYILEASAFNFIGAAFLDKIGRRRMFLIGFPGCALCLLAEALLQRRYVGTGNKGGLGASVFFIFLFTTFYGFCIDPVQYVFAGEIFPTTIRAKGIGLALFSYFVGAITYTTPGALAFRNIGWRYYMVWFAATCVSSVVTYFFIPETTNKSLEEMGALFGDRVVVHITADGQGIVEIEDLSEAGITGKHISDGDKDPAIVHMEQGVTAAAVKHEGGMGA